MLIATAGHVDHGKTTLIRALTGTDCDRLAEEKRRGITIVLGYAEWELPGGRSVSIVDVPGHEKLVKTMLAGAGGLDAVLVAISAVGGVMPQTREHLNACALLGVERAVIAMTFADQVSEKSEAMQSIRQSLSDGPFSLAPIIPVSALTGDGLSELTAAIEDALDGRANPAPRTRLAPCLPVDRTFSIDGFGTVVTGSLIRGQLAVGQTVCILPSGETTRVRGLQVHGHPNERVDAGTRVALNLTCARESVSSSTLVTLPDAIHIGRVFDAEVTWLAHAKNSLKRRRGLSLHLGTSMALADIQAVEPIAPGTRGAARVRLDRAIPLPPGMRFVLRGSVNRTHGSVIAGGRIVDPAPPRRRSRTARVALCESDHETSAAQLIAESGRRGLHASELACRLPIPRPTNEEIHFDPGMVQVEVQRLQSKVRDHHQSHPLLAGVPKAELTSDPIAAEALQIAIQGKLLVMTNGLIASPDHGEQRDPALERMARKVMRAIGRAGLSGPSVDELLERFPADNRDVRMAVEQLRTQGRVIVSKGFCFPAREVFEVRRALALELERVPQVPVSWLKTHTGLTRKHAIPLWTWFDDCGTTIRDGNVRIAGPRAKEHAHE